MMSLLLPQMSALHRLDAITVPGKVHIDGYKNTGVVFEVDSGLNISESANMRADQKKALQTEL